MEAALGVRTFPLGALGTNKGFRQGNDITRMPETLLPQSIGIVGANSVPPWIPRPQGGQDGVGGRTQAPHCGGHGGGL